VALGFIPSDAGLLALQAGVVLGPRAVPRLRLAERVQGPAWALVPIASIIGVVVLIRYASDSATGFTWLALIAVPPLAAAALGWAMSGSRPWLACGAVPLFLVAWLGRGSLAGGAAAAALSALSCVTLGVLLAMVCPPGWLKAGIILMAAADTWLVLADVLQAPNAALVAAKPPGHLPQLQSETFGTANMGYGDVFVAALLGAVLAPRSRRLQLVGGLLTFGLAALFDLLFFVLNELPATVPVAAALIVLELWAARGRVRPRVTSAGRRRSTPAAATPPPWT
jgi:hypothetical protein